MLVHCVKELQGRNGPCREKTKQWSLAENETVKTNNIENMQDYYKHSSDSETHADSDFKITQGGYFAVMLDTSMRFYRLMTTV